MPELLGVLIATLATFVISMGWYSAFGAQLASASAAASAGAQPPPWKIVVEVLRSLTLAVVITALVAAMHADDWLVKLVAVAAIMTVFQ
jgi:hypothetical protein